MPSLIGPELQYLQVSYLFHFGFLGPHYFLQEISDTTLSRKFRRIIGPSLLFAGGFLDPWDMQDLLQSNQHFGLDIIQSKPLSQNNLDHGSQTSTPCLFKKIPSLETFFGYIKFCNYYRDRNKKNYFQDRRYNKFSKNY